MSDRVIVALDHPDTATAKGFVETLGDEAVWMKIGLTLFTAEGPEVVQEIRSLGKRVFLDLKLHDIPHQVEGAVRSLAALGVEMLTVHAQGGEAMMRAAVAAADEAAREDGVERPSILAVTVLTSLGAADLDVSGVGSSPSEYVRRLAEMAVRAGVDGIVCSPLEASAVREIVGPDALVVTPGVRPRGSSGDDQSRVATPAAALAAGASHLVIGRPITATLDPRESFERIVAEIAEEDTWG